MAASKFNSFLKIGLTGCIALLIGNQAIASGACKTGVFLSIGGNITKFNNQKDHTYDYSEAEFMKLVSSSITTSTVWTPVSKFEGPLLGDLMTNVGAGTGDAHLTALDKYVGVVPRGDMAKYGVILATTRDGVRLQRKDHGPLFSMYPRDAHPSILNTPLAQGRFIWQVCHIEVI